MADANPYSRVYWRILDDDKFDGIRESPRHLGAWLMLLIAADMAHPSPAFAPPMVPKSSLDLLANAGLIDVLSGGRYRVHGLASEREMRSQSARNAAAVRWHSNGHADGLLDENETSTRRGYTRLDTGTRARLRRPVDPTE